MYRAKAVGTNVGALIIGIGFWGPIYCNYKYNKEPPK